MDELVLRVPRVSLSSISNDTSVGDRRCGVCRSDAAPVVPCTSVVLSASGQKFNAKFHELSRFADIQQKDKSRADDGDGSDEDECRRNGRTDGGSGVHCCGPCLNLVFAIDFLQVELERRLTCFQKLVLGPKLESLLDIDLVEGSVSPGLPVFPSSSANSDPLSSVSGSSSHDSPSTSKPETRVKAEQRQNFDWNDDNSPSYGLDEGEEDDDDDGGDEDDDDDYDPSFYAKKTTSPTASRRSRRSTAATSFFSPPSPPPATGKRQRRTRTKRKVEDDDSFDLDEYEEEAEKQAATVAAAPKKRGRRPKSWGPNPNPLPPRNPTPAQFVERRKNVIGFLQWLRPSRCRLCPAEFVGDGPDGGIDARLEHHAEVHGASKEPVFLCHFCLLGFTRLDSLTLHVFSEELTRGVNGEFSCGYCSEDLLNPRRLQTHIRDKHPNEKRLFQCDDCQEGFSDYDDYIAHRQAKTGRRVVQASEEDGDRKRGDNVCPRCKEKFTTERRLDWHFQRAEFSPLRCCDDCGLNFKFTHLMEKHVNQFHLHMRPHICQVCGKGYDCKLNLLAHMEYHNKPKEPKICPICGKSVKCFMKYHIAEVHNREMRHKCDMCEERFNFRPALRRHMAVAHNYKAYRFQHTCDICGKVFTSTSGLRQHKFTNHGVRDEKLIIHACNVCGKEFGKEDKLKRHMLTHDGVKPHLCPHCEHRTSDFINLKTHIRLRHKRVIKRVFRPGGGETEYDIVDMDPSEQKSRPYVYGNAPVPVPVPVPAPEAAPLLPPSQVPVVGDVPVPVPLAYGPV